VLVTALAGLAIAPAPGFADQVTFGSDLSAPANVVQARQADTAYWQTRFADGRNPTAPANGQITSFKLKGIALANPVPGANAEVDRARDDRVDEDRSPAVHQGGRRALREHPGRDAPRRSEPPLVAGHRAAPPRQLSVSARAPRGPRAS